MNKKGGPCRNGGKTQGRVVVGTQSVGGPTIVWVSVWLCCQEPAGWDCDSFTLHGKFVILFYDCLEHIVSNHCLKWSSLPAFALFTMLHD